MRLALVLIAALLVVGLAAGVVHIWRPHLTLCNEQERVGDERAEIERAALTFLGQLQSGEESAAIGSMSRRGREGVRQHPLGPVIAFMREFPSQVQPEVERTFLVSSIGWPRDSTPAPCNTAAVQIGETGASAHVIVSHVIDIGERTSTVWLERENGVWRTRAMWANISSVGGYDGDRLWRMAREQRARAHGLNAGLLYVSAEQLLFRAPFVTTRALMDFRGDRSTFETPPELAGDPPHTWRMGGDEFAVILLRYNITTDEGVVYEIHQRLPRWEGEANADVRNRALIEAFDSEHPEWREIARALAARSEMPVDGQLFGTVFDRETGYTQPPVTEESVP